MNVYPASFLERYKIIDENYFSDREPNAKTIRDKQARELRKEGWTVKTETVNIEGIKCYSIFAKKERSE